MKLVRFGDTLHLPCRNLKYPFEILEPPWPLCGLTSASPGYKFEEGEKCECGRCLAKQRHFEENRPTQQLDLFA